MGCDWFLAFRPAALALLAGQSPYSTAHAPFANAPWALLPLIPLAILPTQIGYWLLILVSVLAFGFVAYQLGASYTAMIAFILSPFVMRALWYGQIDWLPMLGIIMPPWLGLFFVAVKPQTCAFIATYWFVEAWRAGTIIRTFAPVVIATLLSCIPFGIWPIHALQMGITNKLWPLSLIFSVALLIVSQRRKDKTLSAAASPLASPYAQPHSFAVILLPLMRHKWLMVTAVAALWIAEFVK